MVNIVSSEAQEQLERGHVRGKIVLERHPAVLDDGTDLFSGERQPLS